MGDRGGERGEGARRGAASTSSIPGCTPPQPRGWWSAHTRRGPDSQHVSRVDHCDISYPGVRTIDGTRSRVVPRGGPSCRGSRDRRVGACLPPVAPEPASYRPEPGSIPTQPGVYRFRDARGRVIYVGKAKNLRARLSSYFQDIGNLHPRTATMVTTARQRRVDGRQHRGRGAPAGVLLDQGVRPALQREVPRRQVLPVARGHGRRGVPAGDGRPRRQAARAPATSAPTATPGRSARPSTCCCGSSRCARAATASSSGPRQIGRPVPARLHRQVLGAVRRQRQRRGAPRDRRRLLRLHGRADTDAFVKRIEQEMYAASDALRTTRRPRGCATTSARWSKALEKQAVVLGDGTDADVIALAEDPLEVAVQIFYVRGGRIRGQRGWVADRVDEGGTAELVEDFLLQLYAGERRRRDPARDPGAGAAAGRRRRFEQLLGDLRGSRVAIRVPQRGDKKTLQETVARNAAPGAGPAQDQAGQRPDHPQPGARGDPAGARARRGAAAHRVLRHLQPPGHRGGRLDGGLRGRPGPQERVPPVRDQGRRRPERRRLDARGDHPAVPAAARRAGARPSRTSGRPTSGPMLVDPETGRPRKFAYAPGPGRRRRRPAAGRGRPAGARRARHRRHPGLRAGQAARGGLAARPRRTR